VVEEVVVVETVFSREGLPIFPSLYNWYLLVSKREGCVEGQSGFVCGFGRMCRERMRAGRGQCGRESLIATTKFVPASLRQCFALEIASQASRWREKCDVSTESDRDIRTRRRKRVRAYCGSWLTHVSALTNQPNCRRCI
jgi:hypothetical protein